MPVVGAGGGIMLVIKQSVTIILTVVQTLSEMFYTYWLTLSV